MDNNMKTDILKLLFSYFLLPLRFPGQNHFSASFFQTFLQPFFENGTGRQSLGPVFVLCFSLMLFTLMRPHNPPQPSVPHL